MLCLKLWQGLFTISEKRRTKASIDHGFEPQQITWAPAFVPRGVFTAISHKDTNISLLRDVSSEALFYY